MSAFRIPQRAPPLLKPLKVATIACIINQDRWYSRRGRRRSPTVVLWQRTSFQYFLLTNYERCFAAGMCWYVSLPPRFRRLRDSFSSFQFRTFCLVNFVQLIHGPRECSDIRAKVSEENVKTHFDSTKQWGSYDVSMLLTWKHKELVSYPLEFILCFFTVLSNKLTKQQIYTAYFLNCNFSNIYFSCCIFSKWTWEGR